LYAFIPLLAFYLIAPLLIWLFPYFFQHIFFLNFVKFPNTDYHNLTKYGIIGGRNFYVNETNSTHPDQSPILGVWHIFPKSLRTLVPENATAEQARQLVSQNSYGILVYLHGNSFDRTTPHRIELYRLLSEVDLHVLAVDYRGSLISNKQTKKATLL
jgi:hypothetical protein